MKVPTLQTAKYHVMVFIYQTPGGDQDVSHAERTDSYLSFVSFFLDIPRY